MISRVYVMKNASDALVFGHAVNADIIQAWLYKNRFIAYFILVLYLVSIFVLQRIMKSRRPFKLERMFTIWNTFMACYSIYNTVYTILFYLPSLQQRGLKIFLCDNSLTKRDVTASLIALGYVFSKIVQLGETFLIVLQKKDLYILHWFHHVTVSVLTWKGGMEGSSLGHYFGPMNVLEHSFMYTYFAVKGWGFKLPRIVPMMITMFQILQMLSAIVVTWFVYIQKRHGQHCDVSDGFINFAFVIYALYAILFTKLFLDSYVWRTKRKISKSKSFESKVE